MSKNKNDYFKLLANMTDCAYEASEKLDAVLQNYNIDTLPERMVELHEIESRGDEQKHFIAESLAKDFITPLDREDLLTIAGEIDDVIDYVEDVLLKIFMFNVTVLRDEAFEFSKLIKQCCSEMVSMMREFNHYKKSTLIHNFMIELNRLEEEGDLLYVNAVRRLYTERDDVLDIFIWTKVFGSFEKCCDACEHVANLVEYMVMKNT